MGTGPTAQNKGREASKTSARARAPGSDAVTWQWCRFSELRPGDLYAAVQLRESVFVVEQNCAYLDADGRDPQAWHLLGWMEDESGRSLVAYARIFEPGLRYDEGSIGRVVTSARVRRTGVGRLLMAEAMRRLESLAPGQTIKLAAQRYLESFYASFGFRTVSAPYEEDGIIHVDMLR
jgi:ElaA protein